MPDWKSNGTYQCMSCHMLFTKRKKLQRHTKKFDHGLVDCQICGRLFSSDKRLQKHMVALHTSDMKHMAARSLWACVPCKITFQSEAELQQHYIAEPVHPKCYVCGQAFRDIVLMLLHMKIKHPDYPPYPAEREGSTVSISTNTEKDSATITFTEFRCNPCNKFYSSDDLLQEHYRSYHPTCALCEQGFEDEEAYDAHVLRYHIPPGSLSFTACNAKDLRGRRSAELSPQLRLASGLSVCSRAASCPSRLEADSPSLVPVPDELVTDNFPPYLSPISLGSGIAESEEVFDGVSAATGAATACGDRTGGKDAGMTPLFAMCRKCCKEPLDPTVTMCGHLFCNECIMEALRLTLRCPACDRALLIGLST